MKAEPLKGWNVFKQIFAEHWEGSKRKHPRYSDRYYNEQIKKMLNYGSPQEMGYIRYLCMRCGKVYVDDWVSQASKMFHKKWQWYFLEMIREGIDTEEIEKIVDNCYMGYPKGFVANVQNGEVAGRYESLARHVAKFVVSPPISIRRIDGYLPARCTQTGDGCLYDMAPRYGVIYDELDDIRRCKYEQTEKDLPS